VTPRPRDFNDLVGALTEAEREKEKQIVHVRKQNETMGTIRPTICDLSESDDTLRQVMKKALEGTLSPMMAVVDHGCEDKIVELVTALKKRDAVRTLLDGKEGKKQEAFDIDGELDVKRRLLKTCLEDVSKRLLRICSKPSTRNNKVEIEGRLCLRVYPSLPKEDTRLGAHVDNTVMTLLFADGPGLQVLDPGRVSPKTWTRNRICTYGLPTTTLDDGPLFLRENEWGFVDLPWDRCPLLFTVGAAWPLKRWNDINILSPVLHRVFLKGGTSRISMPFLVDFADAPAAEPAKDE